MSGLAAAWTRGDAPLACGTIASMLAAMRTRGPHGSFTWQQESVALGFLSFVSTPEALREAQPFVATGGSVLVFDGRIDNRADLQAALAPRVDTRDGDAAYVSAAYERWGADAAAHLVGDFAFVLYDPRLRALFAARDVMGVRPLCYAIGRRGEFLVASELRGLLAAGPVDDAINEARALEHLVDRGQDRAETLYRHIRRLPPAHALLATADGVRTWAHWDFPRAQIRYRRQEEYVEHARDVLRTAVRAQGRSVGRVGVLLSGGIDSSAVAGLAVQAGIPADGFTVAFTAPQADERRFADAVAVHTGMRVHHAPYEPVASTWYEEQASTYRDLPDYPNGAMIEPARRAAAEQGIRVLLTGVGGDEWFTGSPYQYADWLGDGRVLSAAMRLVVDARARGVRPAARELLLCGVWPVLPAAVRAAVKRVHRRPHAIPWWISAPARERWRVLERTAVRVQPRPGETYAHADTRAVAASGFQVHTEEMDDRAATRAGLEQRNPLYDRRVIEFALALPESQRWYGGTGKRLLRLAIAGIVPESVRTRRGKAEFAPTYTDAFRAWQRHAWPEVVARGWIDPAAAERMRGLALGDPERGIGTDERFTGPFWMLHALECWLDRGTRRIDVRPDEHRSHAAAVASAR